MKNEKIRVGILEDHQSTIDGYLFRLSKHKNIEVVSTLSYGFQLAPMVDSLDPDLLILDVSVPTSPENSNPYPILFEIPDILQKHPEIAILVISMHNQRTLIKAVIEAGASGYILKDDREAVVNLGEIIKSVVDGGVYFSKQSFQLISQNEGDEYNLTKRQKEVLSMCASRPNSTTAEIAEKLKINPSTVRNLLSTAYMRLNVKNRTAAIIKARELGLISPLASEQKSVN